MELRVCKVVAAAWAAQAVAAYLEVMVVEEKLLLARVLLAGIMAVVAVVVLRNQGLLVVERKALLFLNILHKRLYEICTYLP
jgi:hypothetical protein